MGALFALVFFLILGGFYFFTGLMWWKVFKKTGFRPAWGILMIVPFANLILLAILAFKEWPVREQLAHYSGSGVTPQRSLAAPLIVAIIIAALMPIMFMLVAIAFPNFMRAKLIANEAAAQSVVKNISRTLEDYASVNNGAYPMSEDSLRYPAGSGAPYDDKTINGYDYSMNLRTDGYEVVASPEKCEISGIRVFLVETGGKIAEKDCR